MSIHLQPAGTIEVTCRVRAHQLGGRPLPVARVEAEHARRRRGTRPSAWLRLSGWRLGKLSRRSTSYTGAPSVSASSTSAWKPSGRGPTNSAMITGRFALRRACRRPCSSAAGSGADARRHLHRARAAAAARRARAAAPAATRRSTCRSGPCGSRHHHAVGAREGFRHAVDRCAAGSPTSCTARTASPWHLRGVDPVDARPALGLVHRPGGADDEHRRAVDVGVVDRHVGVQQARPGCAGSRPSACRVALA